MEYLRQTIISTELDGILNLPSTLRNRTVEVIVLPADNADNTTTENKPKRQLGFAKGAEIPDSFFEPLPEGELQAWGL
jgi:hypothetical protein